jgi:hypothetical protein
MFDSRMETRTPAHEPFALILTTSLAGVPCPVLRQFALGLDRLQRRPDIGLPQRWKSAQIGIGKENSSTRIGEIAAFCGKDRSNLGPDHGVSHAHDLYARYALADVMMDAFEVATSINCLDRKSRRPMERSFPGDVRSRNSSWERDATGCKGRCQQSVHSSDCKSQRRYSMWSCGRFAPRRLAPNPMRWRSPQF